MTLCIYHLSTVFATLFNFFVISLILALRYQLSLDLALKQYIVGNDCFFRFLLTRFSRCEAKINKFNYYQYHIQHFKFMGRKKKIASH